MTQPGIGRLKLPLVTVFLCILGFVSVGRSQSTSATISGTITDQSGAFVVGADVIVTAEDTGFVAKTKTNSAGVYSVPDLKPGPYRVTVAREGFRQVAVRGITLNVQDVLNRNFTLQVGSFSEVVEVEANGLNINTTDASVSTVIDRNFAENIPMNGRSFQTLIELTPGVVTVPAGANHGNDSGQFSVNGQRAAANYWMVDGVSANASSNPVGSGNQLAGATGVTSVFGGTNSLVSVDAMQEFRIQTSTFAPEFGRTPGAQISIVTRSGANAYHGSAFDYLRNDLFDANDWFNGFMNNPPLHKAEERQNDFGGTFSGPILKDQTFFFFSYEGLRLRLPTTTLTTVPCDSSCAVSGNVRAAAVPAMQPFLNAFPVPNGPEVDSSANPFLAGQAQFNATYSNPATLDAYSLRIDHKLTEKFSLFGRYNYSPSESQIRGGNGVFPLSSVNALRSTAQQGTVGLNGGLASTLTNEFRFNYSRTVASTNSTLDSFGGAVPVSAPIPSPYTDQNGVFAMLILFLNHGELFTGQSNEQLQRQVNMVDTISWQKGSHSFKFGVDYRRLTPIIRPSQYEQVVLMLGVPIAATGQVADSFANLAQGGTFLFRNLSLFAQDTWRINPRLNFTYGLRWDTDFAPQTISGPPMAAATGFNPDDFSTIALAPSGTPVFHTNFRNFAPRFGAAYQISQSPNWGLVARGGFGVFYDLSTSETGNNVIQGYPFSGPLNPQSGGTFPLTPAAAAAPPFTPPSPANPSQEFFFDPNLKTPYTLQWNVALEQGLGAQQSLSLTYVGAAGRRLLQAIVDANQPTPSLDFVVVTTNSGTSDYDALQARFERRMAKNMQLFSAYNWSHSIDTGSAGSEDYVSNASTGMGNPGNRGPSAFDIRQTFSAGLTYEIPAFEGERVMRQVTRGWSLQSIFQAHTAPSVDVANSSLNAIDNLHVAVRPDVLPGIPLYLYGSQYPGGKAFNDTPGAGTCADGTPSVGPFCNPPVDANGLPVRNGDLGRNALRGFGLFQWNLGVHRQFPIREALSLEFRAEMFNIINHPNFAPPSGDLFQAGAGFGRSSQMLNNYLGSGTNSGGFSALYQTGGPRSIQFALKLSF